MKEEVAKSRLAAVVNSIFKKSSIWVGGDKKIIFDLKGIIEFGLF